MSSGYPSGLLALALALGAVVLMDGLPSASAAGVPSLTTGGQIACPVTNPSWAHSGCSGGIVDSATKPGVTGSDNLLYVYYPDAGKGCGSVEDCRSRCNTWPNYKGAKMTPLNGDTSGSCSYWSWNGDQECYLYGCGVCKSFNSFSTNARNGKGGRYTSGQGPHAPHCPGGVKGDPHFTGGDSSHFDFTGEPGNTYCLVSDSHLHINAHYGGRYGDDGKPLTWIRQLGLLWGHHSLQLYARQGAEWEYGNGYMARMEVDGQEVKLSQAGDSLSLADGSIQLKWVSAAERSGDDEVDVYTVSVAGVVSLRLTLRPEVAALRTPQDGVVHINIDFEALDLSSQAHGVLGQTYRKDHKDRLSKQALEFNDVLRVHMVKGQNAEGFLDGSVEDYVSSNLGASDCPVSRFARLSALDSETSHAMEFNSGSISSTSAFPRKVLSMAA